MSHGRTFEWQDEKEAKKMQVHTRRTRIMLKHYNRVWPLIAVLLTIVHQSTALKNEFMKISKLCERRSQSFLSNIPHPIDGAVIMSSNERDLDCVVTFQTESILERFMVRFEELAIDCNDKLVIFDGAHAIGNYKANLSCEKTADMFNDNTGVLYTRTNFLTLKFTTDSWGNEDNKFTMIITAFKTIGGGGGCRDSFACENTGICIDNDLVCDHVNHCGDGEDERSSQFCSPIGFPSLFGQDSTTSASITVALVVLFLGISVACWITSIKKKKERRRRRLNGEEVNDAKSRGKKLEKELQMDMKNLSMLQNMSSSSNIDTLTNTTSLMATGNTHHIFDSTPPIQDDPFQQSSTALTSLLEVKNSGNACHPVERWLREISLIATTI